MSHYKNFFLNLREYFAFNIKFKDRLHPAEKVKETTLKTCKKYYLLEIKISSSYFWMPTERSWQLLVTKLVVLFGIKKKISNLIIAFSKPSEPYQIWFFECSCCWFLYFFIPWDFRNHIWESSLKNNNSLINWILTYLNFIFNYQYICILERKKLQVFFHPHKGFTSLFMYFLLQN